MIVITKRFFIFLMSLIEKSHSSRPIDEMCLFSLWLPRVEHPLKRGLEKKDLFFSTTFTSFKEAHVISRLADHLLFAC